MPITEFQCNISLLFAGKVDNKRRFAIGMKRRLWHLVQERMCQKNLSIFCLNMLGFIELFALNSMWVGRTSLATPLERSHFASMIC